MGNLRVGNHSKTGDKGYSLVEIQSFTEKSNPATKAIVMTVVSQYTFLSSELTVDTICSDGIGGYYSFHLHTLDYVSIARINSQTKFVVLRIGAFVALALVAFILVHNFRKSDLPAHTLTPEDTVTLDGISLRVAVADSELEREKGLSGTAKLDPDQGMLFVFENDATHSFWMKDMALSIDMLWISSDGRVVYMEKSVSPDTYPQVFTPNTPARYVLEVPAGFSEAHGVKVGKSKLSF